MSPSNDEVVRSGTAPSRGPLRLQMTEVPGRNRNHVDGGWWPQTRDLAVELPDLVDHFPPRFGRIVRALVSPPDWDSAPRHVQAARGHVTVGSFPRDDSHLIHLTTADRTVLHILVVPPHFTHAQGDEALRASTTAGSTHSATEILHEVIEHADVDPFDHWSDDGGSWWEPGPAAPPSRASG